jgi:hypothetical protein
LRRESQKYKREIQMLKEEMSILNPSQNVDLIDFPLKKEIKKKNKLEQRESEHKRFKSPKLLSKNSTKNHLKNSENNKENFVPGQKIKETEMRK